MIAHSLPTAAALPSAVFNVATSNPAKSLIE
jgi:hypothetical protein